MGIESRYTDVSTMGKQIVFNMEQDKYPLYLGELVANFHSLEFALRAFLWKEENATGITPSQSMNLDELNRGDIVPENAFTNYDTLEQLIDKYNNNHIISKTDLMIDKTLLDIRDAIAHGRVSARTPSDSSKLLKFSRPKGKKVKVTHSISMTKEWFNEQIKRTNKAARKVLKAIEASFPKGNEIFT